MPDQERTSEMGGAKETAGDEGEGNAMSAERQLEGGRQGHTYERGTSRNVGQKEHRQRDLDGGTQQNCASRTGSFRSQLKRESGDLAETDNANRISQNGVRAERSVPLQM
eukprot:TRINITY_DN1765_c0_g1_i3.p3 TRINITY_DN1765_c0_g1~~TRINITY_DN1765_c0_g1_i3.p3  ORF type:complete len:110 (-),score=9.87 TRINITY_DN1765_c0_g1_i3:32-361(-)